MNIPISKNLEEEYKNEVAKGFTLREIISIIAGLFVITGATLLLWWKTELPPDICIYAGLPSGIPIFFLGFWRTQGLTLEVYLREILYEKRTGILTYDADEIPEDNHVFTMERERKKKWSGWRK